MNPKQLGIFAEGVARAYLIKKGYKILAANYKTSFGEIDIIAQKDEKIIFTEVKANKTEYIGSFNPEIRVNPKKKNKLIQLATAYLKNNNLVESAWQIDVISVTFNFESSKAYIKHFKNTVIV